MHLMSAILSYTLMQSQSLPCYKLYYKLYYQQYNLANYEEV